MTSKQIYAELARIAAIRCADGKAFISSRRVGKDALGLVQSRLAALLEKLNYNRTHRDLGRFIDEFLIYRGPRETTREIRTLSALLEERPPLQVWIDESPDNEVP